MHDNRADYVLIKHEENILLFLLIHFIISQEWVKMEQTWPKTQKFDQKIGIIDTWNADW